MSNENLLNFQLEIMLTEAQASFFQSFYYYLCMYLTGATLLLCSSIYQLLYEFTHVFNHLLQFQAQLLLTEILLNNCIIVHQMISHEIIQYTIFNNNFILLQMCITFFCLYPFAINSRSNTTFPTCQESISSRTKSSADPLTNNEITKVLKHKKIKKQKKMSKYKQKEANQDSSQEGEQNLDESNIKFIIAFNRDQQSQRRTLKFGPFDDDPNIYAGRDIKSTGTWLGVNVKTGIMVILTNYDLPKFRHGKSRGQLVKSFLTSNFVDEQKILDHQSVNKKIHSDLMSILQECNQQRYAAFNLLVFNLRSDKFFYICSQLGMKQPSLLQKQKIYGLCNTDIQTIWPKTKHGLVLFQKIVHKNKGKDEEELVNDLSTMMKDTKQFSSNLNDEASIFVSPFYSTLQNAERMTKSTFIAILKQPNSIYQQTKKGSLELRMRQTTYKHVPSHSSNDVETQKQKNSTKLEYDHLEQKTVCFNIRI